MNGEQTIRWNRDETLAVGRALLKVQNGVIAREGADPYSTQTVMKSPLAGGKCLVINTGLFNCSAIKKVLISVDLRLQGDYKKAAIAFIDPLVVLDRLPQDVMSATPDHHPRRCLFMVDQLTGKRARKRPWPESQRR